MEQNNRPLGWTTLEESKHLVEAGLPVETADMRYSFIGERRANEKDYLLHTGSVDSNSFAFKYKFLVPCWSLATLMELMPKIKEDEDDGGCYPTLCKGYNTDKWHCVYRSSIHITDWYDTPIDAAFNMMLWLLENKLIGLIKKKL